MKLPLGIESKKASKAALLRAAAAVPAPACRLCRAIRALRMSANAPASAFEGISGPEQVYQNDIFRIKSHGYTVLRGVWSAEQCAAARARLHVLQDTEQGMGQLYNKGEEFEGCYQAEPVLRLVRHFLGEDAVRSLLSSPQSPGAHDLPVPD